MATGIGARSDDWRRHPVGFFPAFMNLAETSRLVRIAESYREIGGEAVFFSHGGEYEWLAEKKGFRVERVEPLWTHEEIDELMRFDRAEKLGDPFPVPWLTEHVLNEEQAYRRQGVALVVTGFNFPCPLSARKANVPLVYVVPGTSVEAYFRAGRATFPEGLENAFTQLLPRRFKDWATNRLMPHAKTGTRAFNRVARRYGLPTVSNSLSLWRGDYTLISDLAEVLDLPEELDFPEEDYIGPLLANLDVPLEPEVTAHLERSGPTIFLSLGSSGETSLYRQVLETLCRTPYNVLAVYTTLLRENELPEVPENVLLQKLVPAETVSRMVDLAVLHGGQGTFYTAAYAGRPVVGIPMQFEQQFNIDLLVRSGSAIRISKRRFRPDALLDAVDTILADYERFRANAERLANRLPVVDSPRRGAERIRQILCRHVSE